MQLVPGMVLFLLFPTTKPLPKEKFAVLCCVEPSPIFLLINTDQNAFVINTSELAAHQLTIDAASHPFLDYDSWLDCAAPFGYDGAELLNTLRREPWRIKGQISPNLLSGITQLLTKSDLWPPKKMARVVDGLTNAVAVDF